MVSMCHIEKVVPIMVHLNLLQTALCCSLRKLPILQFGNIFTVYSSSAEINSTIPSCRAQTIRVLVYYMLCYVLVLHLRVYLNSL